MPLTPGALVADRYTVLVPLAEGAFGAVWRAVDEQTGVHRALKVLKTDDPQQRARMMLEGKHQHALDHPNIVRVFDILELPEGPALVLELVEGPSLADLLQMRPLDAPEARFVGEGLPAG